MDLNERMHTRHNTFQIRVASMLGAGTSRESKTKTRLSVVSYTVIPAILEAEIGKIVV
jgi:type IV secretory pathway VirB10-like protein